MKPFASFLRSCMFFVLCIWALPVYALPAANPSDRQAVAERSPAPRTADEFCSALDTFNIVGRLYALGFVERSDISGPWPIDLVLRWRTAGSSKWHVEAQIDEVRLEKRITLSDPRGRPIEALVLSSPGGSADFITIAEVKKGAPVLRSLLIGELRKGGMEYVFDRKGRVSGLKFTYMAWHVEAGGCITPGHVYTAMNMAWLPDKHCFRRGPVYVDGDAEEQASLIDVLGAIGSTELLGIEESHDAEFRTHTYVYRPRGLLWRKTPPELRLAPRVRAVIRDMADHSKPEDWEPDWRLVELAPIYDNTSSSGL